MRAGQALRGSSEFHAWGDSNLYLRRHGDQLALAVEHRAAASITAISLREIPDRGYFHGARVVQSIMKDAASARRFC